MGALKIILLVLFAAILVPRIYKIIAFLDIGETVFNHSPGPCEQVKGIDIGSEDIDMIPGTDIALITTGLRHGKMVGSPEAKGREGKIMYFNFAKPKDGAKPMRFKGFKDEKDFNPHGISIILHMGKVYLFVVNHPNLETTIERFEVDMKSFTLTHLQTIKDNNFYYINDVMAISDHEFYFTNYMYYEPGTLMATVELFGQLRYGEICYHDGDKMVPVVNNLMMPNGINQSPDKRYLYTVMIADREIHTFEIQPDHNLTLLQKKQMDTTPDNIFVDPVNGDLWLGCHPVGWKVFLHLEHQTTKIAPSQVLRVKTKDGLLTDDITEVYIDSGNVISASTVAVYHKNAVIIGSISNKAVYCDIKHI